MWKRSLVSHILSAGCCFAIGIILFYIILLEFAGASYQNVERLDSKLTFLQHNYFACFYPRANCNTLKYILRVLYMAPVMLQVAVVKVSYEHLVSSSISMQTELILPIFYFSSSS